MKIYKSGDTVSFVFDRQELKGIMDDVIVQEKNPLHNMRHSTRTFLNELFNSYGQSIIFRNDDKLKNLMRKHYIVDLHPIIRELKKRNIIDVTRSKDRNRIHSFRFINSL